ncbi:hypothetical protein SH528x_002780 [Novipirellula sp. SH528]|uniref:hypothetical protein n=1 Tax=Novipirellula sp. SH528 TaxID=3454466 RepID=UPI003FA06FD2
MVFLASGKKAQEATGARHRYIDFAIRLAYYRYLHPLFPEVLHVVLGEDVSRIRLENATEKMSFTRRFAKAYSTKTVHVHL